MGVGQHVWEDQELLSHAVQMFLAKLSAPNTCWRCSGQRAALAPHGTRGRCAQLHGGARSSPGAGRPPRVRLEDFHFKKGLNCCSWSQSALSCAREQARESQGGILKAPAGL